MIRALRPTDFLRLISFQSKARECELTSHTWPRVDPHSSHFPLVHALSRSITGAGSSRRVWVHVEARSITGVVVARRRCGGLVWDVEHLHALLDQDQAAVQLLLHLCNSALSEGARRVFMETPGDSRGTVVATRAGFTKYVGSVMYALPPPFTVSPSGALDGRPRLRSDEHALFQLYCAAVPGKVRMAEAVTHEEWVALRGGRKKWVSPFPGDRQEYVWERGGVLIGWLEVVYGCQSQSVEMLVHPRYDELNDGLVRFALTQVSPKVPVYAIVRDYQPRLSEALERAGFIPTGQFDIFVRQLAVRMAQHRLVPAKVLSG